MCRIAIIGGNRWDMLCTLGRSVPRLMLAWVHHTTPVTYSSAAPLAPAATGCWCPSRAPSYLVVLAPFPFSLLEPCPITFLITFPRTTRCNYLHKGFQLSSPRWDLLTYNYRHF